MGSLGSLGTPRPARTDTFEWFGAAIRVNPDITDVTFAEFLEVASQYEDGTPEAFRVLRETMRMCVHPDDFDRYWALGLQHRQTTEDHAAVLKVVVEAAAGRPTQRSSGLSAGPAANEAESTPDFVKRVTAGRPDLELGIMEDQLARRRTAG